MAQDNKNNKGSIFWMVALVIGTLIAFQWFASPVPPVQDVIQFSEFLDQLETQKIAEVTLSGDEILSVDKNGNSWKTHAPPYPNLVEKLRAHKVVIKSLPPQTPNPIIGLVISLIPTIIIIALVLYFINKLGGKNNPLTKFSQSKARLLTEVKKRVTFADVAGIDEAKQEVAEIIEFLKDPHKFERLGGKIPKGVLLVGSPGTGKTLLARAIAGEANAPFFHVSGSEFVEMFVGVGASRVRSMFEQGKKNAPCIIFIDEIDSLGRHRGAGLGQGNDEKEQTLNQLLAEMDGFETNEGLIIVAATNRPDVLDPALLRPGRFDRNVVVGLPDVKGRKEILEVHVKSKPLASDVNLGTIARGTPGFSGADLANLVNEAALLAARRNKQFLTSAEFEEARDKVMMGAERRSLVITEEEKEIIAYHEAGHALVGYYIKGNDPLHKVTIIPRGRALGLTMSLPEKDSLLLQKSKAEALLAKLYGGRAAEEIRFGKERMTNGARGDIQQATNLARQMVTEWGMSEKLGPLLYNEDEGEVFLGRSVTQRKNVSDTTAHVIDEEIHTLISTARLRAMEVLNEHTNELCCVAEKLLECETLTGDEVLDIIAGKSVNCTSGNGEPEKSHTGISKNDSVDGEV